LVIYTPIFGQPENDGFRLVDTESQKFIDAFLCQYLERLEPCHTVIRVHGSAVERLMQVLGCLPVWKAVTSSPE